MKVVVFIFCLVGMTLASDVVELTDADFKDKIESYGTCLVEFFAPWCGHCKKLAPEYEVAATALKKTDPPVPLIKVDCIANPKVCGDFGVSGYPTLKIFRGGEVSQDYQGPRVSDGIIKHMLKQVAPATTDLQTVEKFEKFTSGSGAVVIGFFDDAESADAKAYIALTAGLRDDYTFGHSFSAEVNENAGFSNTVVLYRPKHLKSKFEESVIQMEGKKVTSDNVKAFLEENLLGLCGHLTTDNAGKFKKPLLTAFFKVDYVKNVKGTNYWRNRVMKAGKAYTDKLTLSVANGEDFAPMLGEIGIEHGEIPVVLIRDETDKKYVMEAEFTRDSTSLEAFIKEYLAGNVEPKVKSEDVPESNDGPVKVIVGKNFDEIVMDETKDVLIEFYAPWCGHCKSLAPKWDELGKKMKGNDEIVIAKMDATANDSPSQFAVSGFPTIYWAPKNNKQNPVKYNGGREVADFVSYLKQHASSKLKTEL